MEIDVEAEFIRLCGAPAVAFLESPPKKIAATSVELDGGPLRDGENAGSVIVDAVIPKFPKLKHLTMHRWPSMRTLQVESRVQSLTIGACRALESVGDLPRLTTASIPASLAMLDGRLSKVHTIHQCVIDEAATSCLGQLTKVKHLVAQIEVPLTSLSHLSSSKSLTLRGSFESLAGLEGLAKLTNLTVQSPNLTNIDALAALSSLREINFSNCGALRDISALAGHAKIRVLNLTGTKVSAAGIPDVFLPPRRPSPVYPTSLAKRAFARKKKAAGESKPS